MAETASIGNPRHRRRGFHETHVRSGALGLAVIVTLPLSAGGKGKNTGIEKAITAMEYSWAGAQRDGKADVVGPMLAETFTNPDADGHTSGKANLLSNLRGGKWERNGVSDVKVTEYADAAVATGSWRGKGADGDGTKIDRSERWTDTWARTSNGKWQCEASQQTAAKW